MSAHVEFTGDLVANEEKARIEKALKERFDSSRHSGSVEVRLAHQKGLGYEVLKAWSNAVTVGHLAPDGTLPQGVPSYDVTPVVRSILVNLGLTVR